MRIGRTIPPAASPIYFRDMLNGLNSIMQGKTETERFKKELQEYFGVKHCFLVSSGKAALTIILKSYHKLHPDRNEVLIPAFCCYSVPSAIISAGLKIKLCDVNPETLDFDYSQLKELIAQSSPVKSAALVSTKHLTGQEKLKAQGNPKSKLLAILPVHLFGLASDIEQIKKLLVDPAVAVVEDAAQVMGTEQKGQKLGTIGDVGFFSLGRSKSISTVEGGIILTNNDKIAQQIKLQLVDISAYSLLELMKLLFQAFILSIFQYPSFFWFPKSLPFLRVGDTIYDPEFKIRKLSRFQAGLAKNWKAKLFEFSKSRRNAASKWSSMLNSTGITYYSSGNSSLFNFIRYPIRLENGKTWEMALTHSEENGLGIQLTYPDSINGITELHTESEGKDFPAARKLAREILTLPVHPLLSKKDIAKIESYMKSLQN